MIMLHNSHLATAIATAGWHPWPGSVSYRSSYPLFPVLFRCPGLF